MPSLKFQNFLQRLVPIHFDEADVTEIIKARFFVITIILFLVGTVGVFLSWLIFNKGQVTVLEVSLTLVSLSIQIACLAFYFKTRRNQFAARSLIWSHYSMIVALVLATEGVYSPFLVSFIFMPVFCGFVINAKHCKGMLLSSLAVLLLLSGLDFIGMQFPKKISHNYDLLRNILFVSGLVLIIGIFTFYEMMLSLLKRALIDEKNRFLHLAEYDALTGLLSYRAFEQILNANIARKTAFAIYYIDIDNFKALNSRYGHKLGNRMLQQIAARIGNAIRNDDIVARVKSDEFVVIINGITLDTDLQNISDSIKQSVTAKLQIDDGSFEYPDCSIGYASSLSGAYAKSTLVALAKASMH